MSGFRFAKSRLVRLPLLCAFWVLLLSAASSSSILAESRSKHDFGEKELSYVHELLNKEECEKVWSIFWPRFVNFDTAALHEFSKLSFQYYFQLPGQSDDQLSIFRRMFVFFVYGFDPTDTDSRQALLEAISELETIFPGSTAAPIACFGSAKTIADVASCQAQAQDSHLIPMYKEFLSELKRDSEVNGIFVCKFAGDEFQTNKKN